MIAYTITEYIRAFHGDNQSAFSRKQGVSRQQANRWVKGDFVIVNGKLYKKTRDIVMS